MEGTIHPNQMSNNPFLRKGYLPVSLLGIVFLLDLITPQGFSVYILYALSGLLSIRSAQAGFAIKISIAASLLTILGFFLSPQTAHQDLLRVLTNRALAVLVVSITGILSIRIIFSDERREKAILEREKSFEEIKILRGLLPICCSCKKIRNDKGYWIFIESYIKEHSEADFTHGICPECSKKLYPGLFEKK